MLKPQERSAVHLCSTVLCTECAFIRVLKASSCTHHIQLREVMTSSLDAIAGCPPGDLQHPCRWYSTVT